MRFTAFQSTFFQSQGIVKFFILFALAWAEVALGGDLIGHGGDVVYCPGNGEASVRFFDVYEAQEEYGFEPNFGTSEDMLEKIKYVLEPLQKLSPKRAARYWEQAQAFLAETRFVTSDLEDIEDSNHLLLPPGCEIKQVIIQKIPRFPTEKRYVVNEPLWHLLAKNNSHQAALILHEVIYREAIAFGQEDSRNVRFFVANLISGQFAKMTAKDFHDFLVGIGFNDFEYEGVTYRLYSEAGSCEGDLEVNYRMPVTFFHDNGRLKSARPACGSTLTVWGQDFKLDDSSRFLSFSREGQILLFHTASAGVVNVRGEDLKILKGRVQVFEDGSLQSVNIQMPATFYTSDKKRWHCFKKMTTYMWFQNDGYLMDEGLNASYCRPQ